MNEFIKAEKSRIGGMLASYNKQVDDITTEMLGIDAKYKALAKKEKEALSASLVVLKDLVKGASKMYAMLGDDEKEVEKAKTEVTPVVQDETEQVVDNLFPENNEPEDKEAPVEDDQESELDGEGSTDADNVPTVEEEKELDLGNMKDDDTVLDFEKEEDKGVSGEEEDNDGEEISDEDWNEISQW